MNTDLHSNLYTDRDPYTEKPSSANDCDAHTFVLQHGKQKCYSNNPTNSCKYIRINNLMNSDKYNKVNSPTNSDHRSESTTQQIRNRHHLHQNMRRKHILCLILKRSAFPLYFEKKSIKLRFPNGNSIQQILALKTHRIQRTHTESPSSNMPRARTAVDLINSANIIFPTAMFTDFVLKHLLIISVPYCPDMFHKSCDILPTCITKQRRSSGFPKNRVTECCTAIVTPEKRHTHKHKTEEKLSHL